MKRVTALLLTALLALSPLTGVGAAGGEVTYYGQAREFIFAPGSDRSPTDLFDNFKDMMPGDTRTQSITVRNEVSKEVKVNIYLRSLGADAASQAFLSQLHMTVAKAADNEMAYMFDAAADQTAGLTDWVCLGTLYSGGEVNLEVTLQMPVSLDNSFQDAVGQIEWEFRVEEMLVSPDDPHPPTGRRSDFLLWTAVLAGSVLLLIILLFARKRQRQDGQA